MAKKPIKPKKGRDPALDRIVKTQKSGFEKAKKEAKLKVLKGRLKVLNEELIKKRQEVMRNFNKPKKGRRI